MNDQPDGNLRNAPPGATDPGRIIEEFFRNLDAALKNALDQAGELRQLNDEFRSGQLTQAGEDFSKSHERLAQIFAEAEANRPFAAAGLERLESEIEGQLAWLYKRVRSGLDQEFKRLSPRRNPVNKILTSLARDYRKNAEKLPEQLTVPCGHCPGEGEQPARTVSCPIRQLALATLPREAAAKDHPLVAEHATAYDQVQARLDDLWRNLRFHLEVAMADLTGALDQLRQEEEADQEQIAAKLAGSREVVLDILAETAAKLAADGQPLADYWAVLAERLQQKHEELCETLRREIAEAGRLRTRLRGLRQQWALKLTELTQRGKNLLGIAAPKEGAGGFQQRALSLLSELRGLTGEGGDKEERTLLALTDLPSAAELATQAKKLPRLYRRMFELGPLQNREFMVGREQPLEQLEDIFGRWQQGKTCSVAITGPEGSGKSSLLNCFESEFGAKAKILRREFKLRLQNEAQVLDLLRQWFEAGEEVDSLTALVEHILARPRCIIIAEEGHNLLLRVIGGRGAVQAFFRVLVATRGHCLWLISFRKHPWQRLDDQFQISQYFTHQISTLFHDQKQIEEALMLRQRTSGYPLVFLGESDKDDPEAAQKALQEAFFRELFEAGGGNIEAALYFWLLCLDYDPESNQLQICSVGRLDHGYLRKLDRLYLFSLAEILCHGGLNVAEHARIFRLDPLKSRLTLDYLQQLTLLEQKPAADTVNGERYVLSPIFYKAVTSTLESMHILY